MTSKGIQRGMARRSVSEEDIILFRNFIQPENRVNSIDGVIIYGEHATKHTSFVDMICNAIFQAYTTNIKYQLKSLLTTEYILIKYDDDPLGRNTQKDVSIHDVLDDLLSQDIEPFDMDTILYTPFVCAETIRQIAIKRALK